MHEDVGPAPVELGEHRIPGRIAEVGPAHVRQQHHAVEREPVERVSDLLERAVDIGQRRAARGRRSGRARRAPRRRSPRSRSARAPAHGRGRRGTRRAGRWRSPPHRSRGAPSSPRGPRAAQAAPARRRAPRRRQAAARARVRRCGSSVRAYSGAIAAIVTSKRLALGSIGKEWSCSQAPMASEPSTMKRQRS